MFNRVNRLFIAALFTGVLVLLMSGCDVLSGSGEEELTHHRFSYEVYDENGELIRKVTHERIDDIEFDTSLSLFGEDFMSPSAKEKLAEHYGRTPDELKWERHEIILHAEKGVIEEV